MQSGLDGALGKKSLLASFQQESLHAFCTTSHSSMEESNSHKNNAARSKNALLRRSHSKHDTLEGTLYGCNEKKKNDFVATLFNTPCSDRAYKNIKVIASRGGVKGGTFS